MSSHAWDSRASPSPAQPSTGASLTEASPASKQILATFLQELSDAKMVALEDPDIAAELRSDARSRYKENRERRSRQKIEETVQAQASINSAACESEAEGDSDEYGPSKRSRHGRSSSANPQSGTKDSSKTPRTPPAKRFKKTAPSAGSKAPLVEKIASLQQKLGELTSPMWQLMENGDVTKHEIPNTIDGTMSVDGDSFTIWEPTAEQPDLTGRVQDPSKGYIVRYRCSICKNSKGNMVVNLADMVRTAPESCVTACPLCHYCLTLLLQEKEHNEVVNIKDEARKHNCRETHINNLRPLLATPHGGKWMVYADVPENAAKKEKDKKRKSKKRKAADGQSGGEAASVSQNLSLTPSDVMDHEGPAGCVLDLLLVNFSWPVSLL